MTIFSERNIDCHFFCLVIADDLEARYHDDLTTDTLLVLYREVSYRLIFASCFSLHAFEFLCFLDHLLCYESEFSSFMGKYVCLIFIGLYFFIESRIRTVLCFDTALDLLESVIVVPDELLDFARPDIEIENPIGERIQKLSIMRDHEYRPFVFLEK